MATNVSNLLMKLSKNELENFNDFRTQGNIIADEIFDALRSSSSYKIDRVKIAGSVGKRTSLGISHRYRPDFDLVVFVNKKLPKEFGEVLADFERVLRAKYKGNDDFKITEVNNHSVQFDYRVAKGKDVSGKDYGFISFDLLPAANLLDENNLTHEDRMEYLKWSQTERALQAMSEFPNPSKSTEAGAYSTSICESNISFVKNQGPFVHDVIRLAKLWNKKVTWEGESKGLSGRSMMMELVAMDAALKVQHDVNIIPGEFMVKAFQLFLEKFSDIDHKMIVYFPFQTKESQTKIFQAYKNQTTSPKAPLVLDPFNPFNNLASKLTPVMKKAFEAHAKHTLEAIKAGFPACNVEACFDV